MKVKRTFTIGSKWLYYKIYCGVKVADKILREVIKPICDSLKDNNHIEKWFFIRYRDSDNHLRVRFYLANDSSFAIVNSVLSSALQDYIENRLIWKVIIDTYKQEIERYGSNTISIAEDLFCNDSDLCISIISMLEGDYGERIRWAMAMRSIDSLIDDFKYTLEAKFELLVYMKNSFEEEFNADKYLKKQLSSKYRKESDFIKQIMDKSNDDLSQYKTIIELIKVRSDLNITLIEKMLYLQKEGKLEKSLNSFMWSYLHMLCNRIFISKQRIHELVIYFFLYQYHKSNLARNGVNVRELEKTFTDVI